LLPADPAGTTGPSLSLMPDWGWMSSREHMIQEGVLKSQHAHAQEVWPREIAGKADAPTLQEIEKGIPRVNYFTLVQSSVDLDDDLDLSIVLVQDPIESVRRAMLMSSSKVSPVFPAFERPVVKRKPKPVSEHREEATLLKEAIRHLFSSEFATSAVQP